MRTFFYISILVFGSFIAQAQENYSITQNIKKTLDTNVIRTWPLLIHGSGRISNNGRYAGYAMERMDYGQEPIRFVFRDLQGKWELVLDSLSAPEARFTSDSRFGLVGLTNDRLCIQELGTNNRRILPNISYNQLLKSGKLEYLVYLGGGKQGELVIEHLSSKMPKRSFANVMSVSTTASGEVLAVLEKTDSNYQLGLLDIASGKSDKVWEGTEMPTSIVLDGKGEQVSFKLGSSLFYHRKGLDTKIITPEMEGDCKGLSLAGAERFSGSGKYLFLRLKGPELPDLDPKVNPVQVFSYQDGSFNIDVGREQASYLALYEIANGRLLRLEGKYEKLRSIGGSEEVALVRRQLEGAGAEYYWNEKGMKSDYLVSLTDGKRTFLGKRNWNVALSPSGKYVYYQDEFGGDLECMEISIGRKVNLTQSLPIPSKDDVMEAPITGNSRGLDFYGWTANEESTLVYDRYDIWQLDPKGINAPINLTNSYGRKNHTVLRFIRPDGQVKLKPGYELLLCAFNEDTKENGFYRMKVGSGKDPIKIQMGAYLAIAPGQVATGDYPAKARDQNVYLVQRMSSRESANYYSTADFRDFKAVSDIHPEREYQWHNTELVNFTTKEGVKTQAVLYKPDNFDPSRKYPVLFNFYEKEAGKLNAFRHPELTDHYQFNVPMMLARGYLVCLTDIHFKLGGGFGNTVHLISESAVSRPAIACH